MESRTPFIADVDEARTQQSRRKTVLAASALFAIGCVALAAVVAITVYSGSNNSSTENLTTLKSVDWANAGSHSAEEYEMLFKSFMNQYNKQYSDDAETLSRFAIFKQNLDFIKYYNRETTSHQLSINEFADMTREEFRARYIGTNARPAHMQSAFLFNAKPTADTPSSIDWRDASKNPAKVVAVTPIKNQQQCGSCWAFSTTGSLEGGLAISTGKLTSLSEQQLVDCAGSYGNMGCSGGLMDYGFKYVEAEGLCTEESYPYTAAGGSCQASTCTTALKKGQVKSYTDVTQQDNDALLAAVAKNPVSVAIEADQSAFQFYSGGVFDASCGTQLDHGVLVVGYGTDSGKDYWIVKNSWGSSWGQNGYILMSRQSGSGAGICGIAMQPSYPNF